MKPKRVARPRPVADPEVLEEFSDNVESLEVAIGELRQLVSDLGKLVEAQVRLRELEHGGGAGGR